MLDAKLFREKPDLIKTNLKNRGRDPHLVDNFLTIDNRWRKLTTQLDELRGRQNQLSKQRQIEEAKTVKAEIKKAANDLIELEKERAAALDNFPNLAAAEVPVGKDERENIVLREKGAKPQFDFPIQDYLTIAEKLNIIDMNHGALTAGSRFGYLKGQAALLELALIQFVFKKLIAKSFTPVIPPVMIRPELYTAIGRLAADQKEERYFLEKDNLYLVGTAEHTILPLHINETLADHDLPKRYVGFSSCFRREAGSYGKDTKGILRVHQFDKIEMISFVRPEDSEKEHQFLLACQEELMEALNLPYRVVQMCTGDLGWTDYKQYDIETWLPGQNQYRETHSCSNTTDFQTRGIRCKYQKGGFVHALNATGAAIQRLIIAIIENYQTAAGFNIPSVLEQYFL